ncbi:protein of unknown function [Pararobbsia alpina]
MEIAYQNTRAINQLRMFLKVGTNPDNTGLAGARGGGCATLRTKWGRRPARKSKASPRRGAHHRGKHQ